MSAELQSLRIHPNSASKDAKKRAGRIQPAKKHSFKSAHQLSLPDYGYYSCQIAVCQEKLRKKEHLRDAFPRGRAAHTVRCLRGPAFADIMSLAHDKQKNTEGK